MNGTKNVLELGKHLETARGIWNTVSISQRVELVQALGYGSAQEWASLNFDGLLKHDGGMIVADILRLLEVRAKKEAQK